MASLRDAVLSPLVDINRYGARNITFLNHNPRWERARFVCSVTFGRGAYRRNIEMGLLRTARPTRVVLTISRRRRL